MKSENAECDSRIHRTVKQKTERTKVKKKVCIGSLEYYIKLNLKLDFNRLILFQMR